MNYTNLYYVICKCQHQRCQRAPSVVNTSLLTLDWNRRCMGSWDANGEASRYIKIYQDISWYISRYIYISRYMPSQATKHYNSRPMMCILSQLHLSAAPTCAKADKEFASSWWTQGIHRVWHEVVRDPRGIPYSNHTWWISMALFSWENMGKVCP